MCDQNILKERDRAFIIDACRLEGDDPGNLINVLHAVQEHFGYLPAEVQAAVAECLGIPVSQVYGVVSFYTYFTMQPKGKHPISVCTGTACYVCGSENVVEQFERALGIKVGQTTPDGKFSLTCLRCVGACGLAPVVMVGDKIYGRVTPEQVPLILDGVSV